MARKIEGGVPIYGWSGILKRKSTKTFEMTPGPDWIVNFLLGFLVILARVAIESACNDGRSDEDRQGHAR